MLFDHLIGARIIGILQIEQKSKGKAERNDRLFAVPRRSQLGAGDSRRPGPLKADSARA
jgi:hypothetical protein